MREKLYFEEGGEECCPLDYYQERIKDGEEKIILHLAKREFKSGFMWCKENGEIIESGSGACGKLECKSYNPSNGKSGRCRELVNCFEETADKLILTKEGIAKCQY